MTCRVEMPVSGKDPLVVAREESAGIDKLQTEPFTDPLQLPFELGLGSFAGSPNRLGRRNQVYHHEACADVAASF